MGGNRWARRGLGRILSTSDHVSGSDFEKKWPPTSDLYRLWLYYEGEEREIGEVPTPSASRKQSGRRGFTQKEVEKEQARKGRMTKGEAIRHRVRYLTEGGVLGSANFVNRIFERNRGPFGKKRESGARSMREADGGGLCVLRDLKEQLLTPTLASQNRMPVEN